MSQTWNVLQSEDEPTVERLASFDVQWTLHASIYSQVIYETWLGGTAVGSVVQQLWFVGQFLEWTCKTGPGGL